MPAGETPEFVSDLIADAVRRGKMQGNRVGGMVELAARRGQHAGWADAMDWLRDNGFKKASKAWREHSGLTDEGDLSLTRLGRRKGNNK